MQSHASARVERGSRAAASVARKRFGGDRLQRALASLDAAPRSAAQALREQIEAHGRAGARLRRGRARRSVSRSRRCASRVERRANGAAQDRDLVRARALSRRSRRRRARVRPRRWASARAGRRKIGEGEVGLVADAAHHRHRHAARWRAPALVVEGPQVLDRAAAATAGSDVDLVARARSAMQRARQLRRRLRALHQARR